MATWDLQEKPSTDVGGWDYNEELIAYNQDLDEDTGNPVYYNGLGGSQTWAFQSKS